MANSMSKKSWGAWGPQEYNLEFQGSIRNLQKIALFMKFYPELPWNNTEMH